MRSGRTPSPESNRQWIAPLPALEAIVECSTRSRGVRGAPWRLRYAGEAQSTMRTAPTRRARMLESASSPMRTPTSMPSSSRFTDRSSRTAETSVFG